MIWEASKNQLHFVNFSSRALILPPWNVARKKQTRDDGVEWVCEQETVTGRMRVACWVHHLAWQTGAEQANSQSSFSGCSALSIFSPFSF